MTNTMTQHLLDSEVLDAYGKRLQLGDRAVDLNAGCECAILDYCPELGPESLHVQLVDSEGPTMSYWVVPESLVKLPRDAA